MYLLNSHSILSCNFPNQEQHLSVTFHKILDLNISFLKVKSKITKANGQNLAEADKVSVINYPVSSLFSQIDILLGGKVISSSINTYPYRAYIETVILQ